ncbi:MAG: phosphatidyl-myo-inositol alpha-mannosyltransferase [Actinomycetota bacterium]|nr:phosphatidyl-myo-inositol alpha-mannosyltransferase [Actinomycetota bacterium]
MRIGVVSPYSLTIPGGVQGQVLGLAHALRAQGHDVLVLGPCDGPPPEVGVVPLGNSIPTAANGSMAPLAPDPSCALRTIAALRDEHFDVLHLHEPMAPGPTLTCVCFASVPMVATFHSAGDSTGYKVTHPLARRLSRRLSVRCAVSEDAKELASRYLAGEYVVLHNGIEVERFAKATPWPTEGPTILFLSRHESRKGLAVLLDALPHLPSNTRVWVASDGPETGNLRSRTAGNAQVEWLGRIGDEERARRLRGADVLCAPSLHGESFGMVLLEGMAAQTPVVASDIPGYRNVAGCGEAALMVPPGDPMALAGALGLALADRSTADSLVAAGEARASEYSMDRLAETYVVLYQEAVDRRGAHRDRRGRR